MKLRLLNAMAFSSILLFSCGEAATEQTEENTATEEVTAEAVVYAADLEATTVNWRGEVAGVYGHEGFVNLKSGSIEITGENITGGEFVVDMSVIYPTDSGSFKDEDGGRITDFQGHLSTPDFFDNANYPTSTFVITSVEGMTVKGNLTVRGKTNEETLMITAMEVNADGVMASGTLTFDRQKYDVAWVHYMKDMILSDDIKLTISFVATKG